MKGRLLFFSIICIFTYHANAQIIKSKLDIIAGISAREYAHLGLRYQYSEVTQLSVTIGSDLEIKPEENITTIGIDHMFHFGKHSFYSNRSVWYNRVGFTFLKNAIGDYDLDRYSYFNLGLGREMAFNDWFGVNFDLGMGLQFRKYQEKPEVETPLDTRWFTFPIARIQLFFSF
jgi:hypothetical protein